MQEGTRHLLFRHLPTLLWAAGVALVLAFPGGALPRWSDQLTIPWVDPHLDKVIHFVLFAVMAWLVARSAAVLRRPGSLARLAARWPATVGFVLASAYGGAAELAQLWWTERSAEWLDFFADVAGALVAVALIALSRRFGRSARWDLPVAPDGSA